MLAANPILRTKVRTNLLISMLFYVVCQRAAFPRARAWNGRGMATRLINRVEANDDRVSAFHSLQ
jgi:hypothetical protein